MWHNLTGPDYGYDFRGVLDAARAMLDGTNPYVGSSAHALLLANNPYVLPPLIGELTIPLTSLYSGLSVAFLNAICIAAMIGALWLLDVRDPWIYVIVLFSLPFIDSLWLGQPDGLFALALALAWRYRQSWPSAVAIGVLIAAKLLLWPLLLWLLLTRRIASTVLATVTAALLLVGTWAAIGFHGLRGYVHRLSLDGQAFDTRSHSIAAAAIRLGTSAHAGQVIGILVGAALAVALARSSRMSDIGIFTAAIVAGLFVSPLLWTHYLTVLFVPLAITRPRLDTAWLATAAFYLSPVEPVTHVWQILLVPVLGAGLAFAAVRAPSHDADRASPPPMQPLPPGVRRNPSPHPGSP